jgi:C-terminal processing protease CtpA/Prc
MHVIYAPEGLPDHALDKPTAAEQQRMHDAARFWNGGLVKVERLAGNIGYLRVDVFPDPEDAAEHLAAAMSFIADTGALIIDLRDNHGGEPATVALYVSYLYEAGADLHINDIYSRTMKSTREYWASPSLPGRRYANKPVYVLTSSHTFSGGEELAYDLQTEKRATIVGETTGGGANPVDPTKLDPHFVFEVPTGRAINPITKTNWEGVGVKPDVAAPAEKALDVAHLAALQQLRATLPKDRRGMLEEIDHAIAAVKSRNV